MKAQLIRANEELSGTQQRLTGATEELGTSRADLADVTARLTETEEQLTGARAADAERLASLSDAERQLAEAREAAEAARDEAEGQIAEARQEAQVARHEAEVTRRDAEAARQEAVEARRDAEAAQESLETLRDELDAARERVAEAENVRAEAEGVLQHNLLDVTQERDAARSELNAARDHMGAARDQISGLQQQLGTARVEANSAEQRFVAARDDLAAAQERLAVTVDELASSRRELIAMRVASDAAGGHAEAARRDPAPQRAESTPNGTDGGWSPSAQRALATGLAAATEWSSALKTTVKTLGTEGGWPAVVAWLPDPRTRRMQCGAMWVDPTAELAGLETLTWQLTRSIDSDPIATALRAPASVSFSPLSADDRRLTLAREQGLRFAMLVRVGPATEPIALLELLTDTQLEADPPLALALEAVAIQVGLIERLMKQGSQPRWAMGRF
jgi:predicted  nucleic acid-binding Zn-ribbon protein